MKKFNIISLLTFLLVLFLISPLSILAADCPRANLDIIPEGFVQPNEEVTLMARSEGFSAEEEDVKKMVYAWCLDQVYLGTINSGAKDEIAGTAGTRFLSNDKYGNINGDFSTVCDPLGVNNLDTTQDVNFAGPVGARCVMYERVVYCNEENYNNVVEREITFREEDSTACVPFNDPRVLGCGERLIENIGYTDYEDFVPPDFILVREPIEDSDNDGMDDNWELKYFKGRKVIVNRDEDINDSEEGEDYFYMSNDDEEVLRLVQPDRVVSPDNPDVYSTDPDEDGWDYPYNDDDRYEALWRIGVPYLKSSTSELTVNPGKKSDGYNILGEYVMGTDPLNADTDGDGIPDFKDFSGLQQDNTHLKVEQDYGYRYTPMLRIFGIWDKYRNENEDGNKEKYALFTYPLQEDSVIVHGKDTKDYCKFEPTPEDEIHFEVGSGLPLKVGWGIRPSPILRGAPEPVVVTAEVMKGSEMGGLDLEYKWFRENDDGESDPQEGKSGDGKQYFRFRPSKNPCEEEVIGLEIVDESERTTFQELSIPVGLNTEFDARVIGNVDPNNEKVVDFNQHVGADIDDYSNLEDLPFLVEGEDPFKDFINEESSNRGFRKWDLVELEVGGIETEYDGSNACTEKYGDFNDEREGINSFDFKWDFKRREQTMQSGKGMDFAKALFILKGDPRQFSDIETGVEEDSQVYDGTDWVSFELVDKNENVMTRQNMSFPLISPSIEMLDISGVTVQTSDEDDGKVNYYASPGDEVSIRAGWRYFRPSKGFKTNWRRNDVLISPANNPPPVTESTFTFTAGYDSSGDRIEVDKEVINLKIDSEVNVDEAKKFENASRSFTIHLGEPDTGDVDTALGGALRDLLPSYYKNVFNLFMVVCIAGGALLFVLSFGNKIGRKK